MKLFISPTKQPDWKINKDDLTKDLKERWSNIIVEDLSDSARKYCLNWEISDKDNKTLLEGRLDNDCTLIVIESDEIKLSFEYTG